MVYDRSCVVSSTGTGTGFMLMLMLSKNKHYGGLFQNFKKTTLFEIVVRTGISIQKKNRFFLGTIFVLRRAIRVVRVRIRVRAWVWVKALCLENELGLGLELGSV
jgi:hypothetical protein